MPVVMVNNAVNKTEINKASRLFTVACCAVMSPGVKVVPVCCIGAELQLVKPGSNSINTTTMMVVLSGKYLPKNFFKNSSYKLVAVTKEKKHLSGKSLVYLPASAISKA